MATDYMTVLEHEIGELEPRLWRLKQAVDVPDPRFDISDAERKLMEIRYETTLRLYRIMLLQHELFSMEKKEVEDMMVDYDGSVERLLDATEDTPEYGDMQECYERELELLDTTSPYVDTKWMSVTRPQDSMWKDYPKELKDRLHEDAEKMLRKTMGNKKYDEQRKAIDEDAKLDYFQRYAKNLESVYSKSEIKKKVAAEKKYYKDLERWNRNGGNL